MTEECVGCSAPCDTSRPDEDGDGYLCPRCAKLPGPKTLPTRTIRSLEQLGTTKVLAVVERHGWSLARAAHELKVYDATLTYYLERDAPEAIAKARAEGQIRHGGVRRGAGAR